LDGWPVDAPVRAVRYRVTHTETALEHARMGRCAAYFARFVVELHNRRSAANRKLVLLPAVPAVNEHRQPVYVVARDGEVHAVAALWLAAAVGRVTHSTA
jgi:DNA-binding transcriptional LysR family regulator